MHRVRMFLPVMIIGAGGCAAQYVPFNPLRRSDLPAGAVSGFIVHSHGHQATGFKAAWKENGRVYILTEQTRLGPREETPFGNRPTDKLTTVLQVPADDYDRLWFTLCNHNMWLLWHDPGIWDSEITWNTLRWHHVLLWNDEGAVEMFRRQTHLQSVNSFMMRDSLMKMSDQGLEYLERYFRGGLHGRPYYLIRDEGKTVEIPVEPEGQSALVAELKHAQPDRRAAAAVLLGELGATNEMRAGLDGLLDALDAGEKDDNTRRYMIWAVGRMYPRYVELIDKRQAGMNDKTAAEQLRAHLTKEYPDSVLRLGSATEKK